MENDYICIENGPFKGVSYRIREAKVVEKDGESLIYFDYDVKDIEPEYIGEFEKALSNHYLEELRALAEANKGE